MEGFPKVAAEAKTEIRGNDNEGQEVECDGANRVFQRLAGGVDGVDEVQKANARVCVDEQDGGMQERKRESGVGGPVVEAEVVESTMGPGAVRSMPNGHELAEK